MFSFNLWKWRKCKLENTINKIGNKFDITDWNNKNIEKEVLEEDIIAKDNYAIDVLNKNLKK